ncbi:nonstructural protein [Blackfly microvirus SF02]|uniref:Nonstructural protein n=1 Tax=Blackfly microvirus SF02 TaxID=2576452 RepID=A0A4V1F5D1_9VIRU|nr:nonstructural protein [Blackfly microvirus SF02]
MIATRDIVSNLYSVPMFVPSIGGAIRAFGDECQRDEKNNSLFQHPEDYELWHLGEYDDNNGTILVYSQEERKQIAVGANYRRSIK